MVLPDQFLERPTLIPSGANVLEGLWHRGERAPPCLVLPPEGDRGGMDQVLATELVWAISRAGHATLRFNLRGVGASQGARGDATESLEDARAALKLLRENTEVPAAVVVALPGAERLALSLALAEPALAGLGFVNPEPLRAQALNAVKRPLFVLAPERSASSTLRTQVEKLGGRFVVVPGADATFREKLPEVGREAARWIGMLSP